MNATSERQKAAAPTTAAQVAGAMVKPEKDYLGHPNMTTKAFGYFDWAVAQARDSAAIDPRHAPRQVGIELLRVNDRIRHGAACFEAIIAALPTDSDADAVTALLTMADEYQQETVNVFCKLAGETLAALEQGGLA